MLDAMGIGLILPVMPALIQEVSLTSMSDAALWGGLLTASYAAMQFCFGPFLGNLSDRFGRRPVLIVSRLLIRYISKRRAVTELWLHWWRIWYRLHSWATHWRPIGRVWNSYAIHRRWYISANERGVRLFCVT